MKRLIKLIALTIMMQLIYFGGYCQSNAIPSTGVPDSLTISIDVVKNINKKLIELEYSKEEIKLYKDITVNNRIIIDSLEIKVSNLKNTNYNLEQQYNKEKNHKNFYLGGSCFSTIIAILLIIF